MRIAVWAYPSPERFPREQSLDAHLKKLKDAGVETYIAAIQSKKSKYTALYKSKIIKPSTDYMSTVCSLAERHGIEVQFLVECKLPIPGHPEMCYTTKLSDDDIIKRYNLEPRRIKGFLESLCPSWSKEYIDRNVSIYNEIFEQFPGCTIHLDFFRYVNADVLSKVPCLCDRCRQERTFILGKEVPTQEDLQNQGYIYKEISYRNKNVLNFVKAVRKTVDAHKGKLTGAVRALYRNDALVEGQDWVQMTKDGLLDQIYPMSYRPLFKDFKPVVDDHVRLCKDFMDRVFEGIGRGSSFGHMTTEVMIQQLEYVNGLGFPGACIFSTESFTDEDYKALTEFKEKVG